MSQSAPPKAVLEFLRSTRTTGAPALLLLDQPVEGTVVFNGHGKAVNERGEFFPSKVSVPLRERKRTQLLMAKSRVVLNVIISPQPEDGSTVEHLPFEMATWESLEEMSALQTPALEA